MAMQSTGVYWISLEMGHFGETHLVPIPQVKDLAALNGHLLLGCRQGEQRAHRGQAPAGGKP